MDRVSREIRSHIMSQIRGKHTKPEIAVRSLLHKMGYRFRLHSSKLPGKPDIVLPKYKIAIYVHGCFWHLHKNCKIAHLPKSRIDYWHPKLKRTVERDAEHTSKLTEMGWKVVVVWECETDDRLTDILKERLNLSIAGDT